MNLNLEENLNLNCNLKLKLHYPNPTQPQPQPIPHPYPNPTLTLTFWLGVSYYTLSHLCLFSLSSRLVSQVKHLLQNMQINVNIDSNITSTKV